MLILLHIENIAVIERADIEFDSGFTVMTGETGAGKSIIIDSINAIMGQRTNKSLVRAGAEKGFVSAVFTQLSSELLNWLQENQLEGEEKDTLYIQRQISQDGKSVCKVNMKPVSISVLKQISPYLINIHGQHDGQKLMDESYHIDFLDSFSKSIPILQEYKELYQKLIELSKKIKALDKMEEEKLQRIDMLKFHIDEIEQADLKPFEDETLLERKNFFDNIGKLVSALEKSYVALDGGEETIGACELISLASNSLNDFYDVSKELKETAEKAEEIKYLTFELKDMISNLISRTDFSQEERVLTEERLDTIYKLKSKYGEDINKIIDYAKKSREELSNLELSDRQREKLLEEYKKFREIARNLATQISQKRNLAAKELEKAIVNELMELDMQKVKFAVKIETGTKLSQKGFDNVKFQISVNTGEQLKSISKVASGGELSRIMLAIKNVLTINEPVGTLIFDEIDTGVSGRAAQKIAHKLSQIGQKKQTICVTHLPQIASMGNHHMLISKSFYNEKTYTNVTQLNDNNRIEEVARMISGDCITDISRKNASELIKEAIK